MVVQEIIILLLAGLGGGIITGLLGVSAAMVAAPLLIIFLGYDAFTAIGVGLVIEVFAAAVTAYNFRKHGNINLKPAFLILGFAVIGAFLGSYFSSYFHTDILSNFVGVIVLFAGINLIRYDSKRKICFFKGKLGIHKKVLKVLFLIFVGLIVGVIAGIFGTGGGMTMLMILTLFLGYKIHPAIGTSVFIMIFISISGAIGHFIYGNFIIYPLVIASIGGIIGAFFTSKVANISSEKLLSRVVGFILFLLGLFLLVQQILTYTGTI